MFDWIRSLFAKKVDRKITSKWGLHEMRIGETRTVNPDHYERVRRAASYMKSNHGLEYVCRGVSRNKGGDPTITRVK